MLSISCRFLPSDEKQLKNNKTITVDVPKGIEEETEELKVKFEAPRLYDGDEGVKSIKPEQIDEVLGLRNDYLGYGKALSSVWQTSLYHGYLPKYPGKRFFGHHLEYKDNSLKEIAQSVIKRWRQRCPSLFSQPDHFTNTFIEYSKGDRVTAGSYGYRMFRMYRDLSTGKLELRADTVDYLKWLEGNRISIVYHLNDPLKTYHEYHGFMPWEHNPKYRYYLMGLPGDFLDETISHELTHDYFKQYRRNLGYQQIGTAYFEESIALVMNGLCYHSTMEDLEQVQEIIESHNQDISKWPYSDFDWSDIFEDYSQQDGEAHYHYHISIKNLIVAQKITGDWVSEDHFIQVLLRAIRNMKGRIVSCKNLSYFCAGLFSWEENFKKYGTPKPMVFTLAELLHQLEKETKIPEILKPFWHQIKLTLNDIELAEIR